MATFGLGRTVRLVNRVVDEKGEKVPQEYMYSGEAFKVRDTLDVPEGIARIVIHQSMYKLDSATGLPAYKLGAREFGIPIDDLPLKEIERDELLDRPESQKKRMELKRIVNPINPGQSRGPAPIRPSAEGAQPGEFGFRD